MTWLWCFTYGAACSELYLPLIVEVAVSGSFCLGYGVLPMVLHLGVNPSSHCRCGGGGSFCLGYGVLPIVLHIGVNLPLIVEVAVVAVFALVMVFDLWCCI